MIPSRDNYDIAVVGGGYFGCSIAIALAEQGHRVLLCEARGQLLNAPPTTIKRGFIKAIIIPAVC